MNVMRKGNDLILLDHSTPELGFGHFENGPIGVNKLARVLEA